MCVACVCLQVLDVSTQPRRIVAQQHEVDRQPPAAALSLHRYLRSARHAAVRRQVQLQSSRRQTAKQLRLVLAVPTHRLSGAFPLLTCGRFASGVYYLTALLSIKVCTVFGQPFVKRFALCYQTVVCLSASLVYCGQMVGWIKMKLGVQVGLDPGHIVLDGDLAPPPQKGAASPAKGAQQPPPLFRPMSVVATVAHLSYC